MPMAGVLGDLLRHVAPWAPKAPRAGASPSVVWMLKIDLCWPIGGSQLSQGLFWGRQRLILTREQGEGYLAFLYLELCEFIIIHAMKYL